MNIGILSFSGKGEVLGERIREYLKGCGITASASRCRTGELSAWTREHFPKEDALLFIGACGIAIRAIAPFIQSKATDPAVLVADDCGRFLIPILSGHLGGANDLAVKIGEAFGMKAVITTATDSGDVFAFDSWAKKNGLRIPEPACIKKVSAALLAGKKIRLKSDFPVTGDLPEGVQLTEEEDCDVRISWKEIPSFRGLQLVPPVAFIGLGCRKNTPEEKIREACEMILKRSQCHVLALKEIVSIDRKKDEKGIVDYCRVHSVPFRVFSAEELSGVKGKYASSDFVRDQVGVDNVCERSAVLASGGGTLVMGKTITDGVTVALAISGPVFSLGETV